MGSGGEVEREVEDKRVEVYVFISVLVMSRPACGCTRIHICKREERRKLPEKGKGRARRPRMRSGPGGQKSLTKNTAYANEASKRTRKSRGHTSRGKNAAAHPPRPPSSPATDPSGPLLRTAPTGVGDHKGRDRPPGEQTDRMRG